MKPINQLSAIFIFVVFSVYPGRPLCAQDLQSLDFPVKHYQEKDIIVNTSSGPKALLIHAYLHLPYVSKPVDKNFQSMNVFVPIKINDLEIDAANAPIYFDIAVGGYMSVNNAFTGFDRNNILNKRAQLALGAGYVVVSPGCRGRDNQADDGHFFGKAPAAIVDLKAAVRYIRHNEGILPGNVDQIISVGCSAGGALSALLGTSGNDPLFFPYLEEIGACDTEDHIFGSACYSPITDLEHADMAYEWMYGSLPTRSGLVDQELSRLLKESFQEYQNSLNLSGQGDFGLITAENYEEYLLKYYLEISAKEFLLNLPVQKRMEYLEKNSWIDWKDGNVAFSFDNYLKHIGRMKGLPAFDDFGCCQPEPLLFGNDTINARHFTDFSQKHTTGDENAGIEAELDTIVNMMNAFYFLKADNEDCAPNWWLRNGTKDNHTSQTVMINLATLLQNMGKNVNASLFWDGGHCADYDPEGLIDWIFSLTEYNF